MKQTNKFELAKKILEKEGRVTAGYLANALGISMSTAYNLLRQLSEWCEEVEECEVKEEGRRTVLYYYHKEEEQQQKEESATEETVQEEPIEEADIFNAKPLTAEEDQQLALKKAYVNTKGAKQ